MNVTPVKFFSKKLPQGAIRLCVTICTFLVCAVPALADPITSRHVVQTLSSSQGTLDLRLNSLQDPATTKSGTQQGGPRAESSPTTQPDATKIETIIAGVAITAEGQQLGVDYEEGEVDGTICDCGEIPLIAGGGFPKWSFLFLGAVPLAFINHCDDCDSENESPTPTPTPTLSPTPFSEPTPTPTPEPGTLLLAGSGLVAAGAGLRRRYAKMKQQTEEEE